VDGKESELEGVDWIHLAEDRGLCVCVCVGGGGAAVNMAMNHLLPENDGEYLY